MTESKRVLLIDDDEDLSEALKSYLERFGWDMEWSSNGLAGMEKLSLDSASVVILDVMLPGRDGFSVCKDIRDKYDVPVIMLSARGQKDDRVMGLTVGAEDYLSKPFEPRELVARIDALYSRFCRSNRNKLKHGDCWEFEGLKIIKSSRQVKYRGQELGLTAMEFDFLLLLTQNEGKRYSRNELLNKLQGIDADIYTRSVDVLVSRVRKKLRNSGSRLAECIISERNNGYVFLIRGKTARVVLEY